MANTERGFIDRNVREPAEKTLNMISDVSLIAVLLLGAFGEFYPTLSLAVVSMLAYFGEQALKPKPRGAS